MMKICFALLLVCSVTAFAMDDKDEKFWDGIVFPDEGQLGSIVLPPETDITEEINVSDEEDLPHENSYPKKIKAVLQQPTKEGSITTCQGVVEENSSGKLICNIVWNEENKACSGRLDNNGYSADLPPSMPLSAVQAKQYYDLLVILNYNCK